MKKIPEKFGLQQKIINEITSAAKENKIEKIFLFGSRARGDFNEKSDIDIAISGGNAAGFCLMINEDVSTLLKFDIVCLDTPIQDELRSEIEKDGMVIYENEKI